MSLIPKGKIIADPDWRYLRVILSLHSRHFFLGSMFSRDREEDQSVLKSSKMIKNERHIYKLCFFFHREIFQKIMLYI